MGHLVDNNSGKDAKSRLLLSDARSLSHVFVQNRPVRKYKEGDGKASYLLHPFDVWLQDRPSHIDAPPS